MTPPHPGADAQEPQYSLAEFGRRVPGLDEGAARKLFYAKPSKLPDPDGTTPSGKPWWRESTVDAYTRRLGRQVPGDARWPLNWPAATTPAPLLPVADVTLSGPGARPSTVSVLVYDTPVAPVAYVLRHQLDTAAAAAAAAAARVLPAADWKRAVVLVADFVLPGSPSAPDDIDFYRLVPRRAPAPAAARPRPENSLLARLTALAGDTPDPETPQVSDPAAMRAEYAGGAWLDEVAAVLGRPLPLWLDGTCTPAAVRQSLAYGDGAPIPLPDTTTGWPATRDRITAAITAGMPERFPQAFSLVAADAVRTFTDAQTALAATARTGDGWYIAALPATPSWPIQLEHQLTTAAATDLAPDTAAEELPRLRAAEADLPWDDPAADTFHEGAGMLAARLRATHPEIAHAPVRQAVETGGPVTIQYLDSLTRLPDDETAAALAHPTRRIARLLTGANSTAELGDTLAAIDPPRALYRAPDGRLTAEHTTDDDTLFDLAIEWPTGMPRGWTDDTRIAADPHSPALVVALTPHPDGGLHTDLLPHPGHDPGYSWGYSGTGPLTLYRALIRCTHTAWDHPLTHPFWTTRIARHPDLSPLFADLAQRTGPLRLTWRDVRAHAEADLATLARLVEETADE